MKRNRIISIVMTLALLSILLPVPTALAADYWICPDCGKRVREIVGDICPYCGFERHVHDWAPASCVTPKTCKTCGETEGAPDPANHTGRTELRGQRTAGCTLAGYTGDTHCADCGRLLEKGQALPAQGHSWQPGDVLAEATCIAPGLRQFTCAVCGLTMEMETELDPAAHTGGTELRDNRAATCGEAGYTGDTYCLDCGVRILTGRVIRATGRHDWQDATCTDAKTCRVCGATEGGPLGHSWDEGTVQYPATCKVEGLIIYTCRTCGQERTELLPIDPGAHAWNDGEIVYPATCVRVGMKHYTCTVCGEYRMEVLPEDPANHEGKTEVRDARAPSCTAAGSSGDTYCAACGQKLADGEQIPATGHRWDAGTVIRAAGCRSTGVTVYHCLGCGRDKRVLVLPDPANHMGGREIRNARPATCGADGYTGDAWCLGCGEKISDGSVIPATGEHTWEAATCTEPKTCKVCGATEGEANGHDWMAATCTEPKTCKVCALTEGKANGHDWQAATCTEPETCKICGMTEGEALGHDWQAATCTAPKTCRVCGVKEGEPAGHQWDEGKAIRPATCSAPGITRFTCVVCGLTKSEAAPMDPDRHTWNDGKLYYSATCAAEGLIHYTCTGCGAEKDEILPVDPENHAGGKELRGVKEATCEEAGYTGDTYCTGCGAKMASGKAIPATGHDWQAATCTEPKTCRVCGKTEGNALEHFWKNAEILQKATCVETGLIRYYCMTCGTTKDEVLPMDPKRHAGGTELRGAKEATCEEAGYTGDTYCTGCGAKMASGKAIPATGHDWQAATCTEPRTCRVCGEKKGNALGHFWKNAEILQKATCVDTGLIRYYCLTCGTTKDEVLPVDPKRHAGGTELRGVKEATCEEAGYTGDTYCVGCGAKMASGKAIPATGHDWRAATCTEPRTCRVCGEIKGNPLGHFWKNAEILQKATCVDTGLIRYYCLTCGTTKDEVLPVDSKRHAGGTELRGAKEVTCEEAGYTGDTYCVGCGAKMASGKAIPATGHDWRAATCTEPRTCRLCGEIKGNPLGHFWKNAEILQKATCVNTGLIRYYCMNCGTTKDEVLPVDSKRHAGGTELRGAKEATCEETGYTGDTYCVGCGAKMASGKAIPATGHDWQAATTKTLKTCRVCGKTESKPLLSPVTGLKSIVKTATSITISWDALPGAEYYSVYQRRTGNKYWTTKNSHVSGTDYTFTNLAADTEYDFRVIVHADDRQSNGMVLKRAKTKKSGVAVGDIVTFGTYPQTAEGTDKTPIEWQVLEVDNAQGKALLISKYGLDTKPYNKELKSVTWSTCTLREWLNKDFLETAFTKTEQGFVLVTEVDNSLGQGYWSTSEKNTQDKIYLLSYAEANRYFNVIIYWKNDDNIKSRVSPTAYAKQRGALTSSSNKTTDGEAAGWWWIRSPGSRRNGSKLVRPDGSLFTDFRVNFDYLVVRPVLWVSLDSGIF